MEAIEEGGEEEDFNKVEKEEEEMEKKGGFAGCPLRREAGKFAGRANSGLEVTPTSEHRRRSQNLGRRSPWGRRRRDGRIVLDLIHLAFRRLANWHLGC